MAAFIDWLSGNVESILIVCALGAVCAVINEVTRGDDDDGF